MGNYIQREFFPEIREGFDPSYSPDFGFAAPRKERRIKATPEEMRSAQIPPEQRDYCADVLIKYLKCRRIHFPYLASCHHDRADYEQCYYEDYILRLKEYEREVRLLERKKRREGASRLDSKVERPTTCFQ